MNASDWIALGLGLPTLAGGGTVAVSKLTRIAVACENLGKQIEAVVKKQDETAAVVQEHENRLNKANL